MSVRARPAVQFVGSKLSCSRSEERAQLAGALASRHSEGSTTCMLTAREQGPGRGATAAPPGQRTTAHVRVLSRSLSHDWTLRGRVRGRVSAPRRTARGRRRTVYVSGPVSGRVSQRSALSIGYKLYSITLAYSSHDPVARRSLPELSLCAARTCGRARAHPRE